MAVRIVRTWLWSFGLRQASDSIVWLTCCKMSSLAIVTRFHHLNEPAQNEEKLN